MRTAVGFESSLDDSTLVDARRELELHALIALARATRNHVGGKCQDADIAWRCEMLDHERVVFGVGQATSLSARDGAQASHFSADRLDRSVYLFFRREAAKTEAQRASGKLVVTAEGAQHI